MGMYDVVLVNCPKCGKENEFQSKSGSCTLSYYKFKECPDDVFEDINRHAPYKCDCGILIIIDTDRKKVVEYLKENP